MEEQAQQQQQANDAPQVAAPDHGAMMAIVSGDSDCGGDATTDDEDIFPHGKAPNRDPGSGDDASLYDENLDEEDEEYVYMNLRGGKQENTASATDSSSAKNKAQPPSVKKPRNSDAVLSCPCCFNIVCMDCQKHHRYNNQFRAMFVLGITVDWQHMLKYDDKIEGLTRWYPPTANNNNNPQQAAAAAAVETPKIVAPDPQEEDQIYYAVSCANCQTQVAALDMSDEVYHFYDCLASA